MASSGIFDIRPFQYVSTLFHSQADCDLLANVSFSHKTMEEAILSGFITLRQSTDEDFEGSIAMALI